MKRRQASTSRESASGPTKHTKQQNNLDDNTKTYQQATIEQHNAKQGVQLKLVERRDEPGIRAEGLCNKAG
jgi:hypothetical protein